MELDISQFETECNLIGQAWAYFYTTQPEQVIYEIKEQWKDNWRLVVRTIGLENAKKLDLL